MQEILHFSDWMPGLWNNIFSAPSGSGDHVLSRISSDVGDRIW